jgi:NitT/TauT family transport system ATP-binding protein
MIGVSPAIAARLKAIAGAAYFSDARAAAEALRAASDGRRLRIGVPWLFSMHALLLDYWLGRSGFSLERDVALTVVPPVYMAETLAAGEIDMFCVGEPWGSFSVDSRAGELFLPASAIWRFAPEKALGVGPDLAETRPDVLDALLRALYRAAEWASRPEHHGALSELLARDGRLECPADTIERAFSGSLIPSPDGGIRSAPAALELFDRCATFPWASQERWIATQLAARYGGDIARGAAVPPVFRPDIYRRALAPIGAALPSASAKIEGALDARIQATGVKGLIELGPDRFFDGASFDPDLNNSHNK